MFNHITWLNLKPTLSSVRCFWVQQIIGNATWVEAVEPTFNSTFDLLNLLNPPPWMTHPFRVSISTWQANGEVEKPPKKKKRKSQRWVPFAWHNNKSAVGANIHIHIYIFTFYTLQTHLHPPPTWLPVFLHVSSAFDLCVFYRSAIAMASASEPNMAAERLRPWDRNGGLRIACHMEGHRKGKVR